jgi:hypothetical protein
MKRKAFGVFLAVLASGWAFGFGCTPLQEGLQSGLSDGISAALAALIEAPVNEVIDRAF